MVEGRCWSDTRYADKLNKKEETAYALEDLVYQVHMYQQCLSY